MMVVADVGPIASLAYRRNRVQKVKGRAQGPHAVISLDFRHAGALANGERGTQPFLWTNYLPPKSRRKLYIQDQHSTF
jgi:hypothetical protein